jgi:hypothetical protein
MAKIKKVTPFTKLNKLYGDHYGYLQLHAGSLVSATIVITIVFFVVAYLMVKLYMNELRKNFDNIKCHPAIIPFAGQIKIVKGMTPVEFTSANWTFCLTAILKAIVNLALTPIFKLQEAVLGVFKMVFKAYTLVRQVFDKIRAVWADMFTFIMSKMTAIIVPFQTMLIKIKDLLEKTGALMGTFAYIIMGMDMGFSAYMATLVKQLIISLIAGAIVIALLFVSIIGIPAGILGLIVWIGLLVATVIVHNFLKRINYMTQPLNPEFPPEPKKPPGSDMLAGLADLGGKAIEAVEEIIAVVAEEVGKKTAEAVAAGEQVVADAEGNMTAATAEKTNEIRGTLPPAAQPHYDNVTHGASSTYSDFKTGAKKTYSNATHVAATCWSDPLNCGKEECFSPTTLVTMADGSKKMMKNIEIGEKLKGGIEVSATLKIKNIHNEPYYKIYSKELKKHIYVTATHLIQDPDTLRFIQVANSRHSVKTNIRDKQFSCLVTTTHTIPIGEYTFWDWED